MSSKVIAIGLDPSVVDYTAMPRFTPQMFRNYIEAQIERVRSLGCSMRQTARMVR